MTGTIIAGILWLVSIWAVPFAIAALLLYVGVVSSVWDGANERTWPAGLGLVAGWVVGFVWIVFAITQVIIHIITVVQLASAGG